MGEIVCFGEIMLRLTTDAGVRIADAHGFDACYGGAEANTAVLLAQLGREVEFVTRLPQNELRAACIARLRARGVGTHRILAGGARMGVYFVEPGAGLRPGGVLYDRAGSAFAEIRRGMFDWDAIFEGARWFHWSGITPALGGECAAVCREACEAARRRKITVSFDINHRAKLWDVARAAVELQPLMEFVDVCVCGEDEAVAILGAESMDEEAEARLPAVAASLAARHGFSKVAMTIRGGGAHAPDFRAMLHTGGAPHFSRVHPLAIVDRIGTGDAFSGGLIHALMRGSAADDAIEFAAAAAAWKHTITGDWITATEEEIEVAASGSAGAGRILR